MFIELTEIVKDKMQSYNTPCKTRKILINIDKIQAVHGGASDSTTLELRRESITVKEDYETVKKAMGV